MNTSPLNRETLCNHKRLNHFVRTKQRIAVVGSWRDLILLTINFTHWTIAKRNSDEGTREQKGQTNGHVCLCAQTYIRRLCVKAKQFNQFLFHPFAQEHPLSPWIYANIDRQSFEGLWGAVLVLRTGLWVGRSWVHLVAGDSFPRSDAETTERERCSALLTASPPYGRKVHHPGSLRGAGRRGLWWLRVIAKTPNVAHVPGLGTEIRGQSC